MLHPTAGRRNPSGAPYGTDSRCFEGVGWDEVVRGEVS
jgi:hypothetical protein